MGALVEMIQDATEPETEQRERCKVTAMVVAHGGMVDGAGSVSIVAYEVGWL